jgi:ferrous iron transport protein A
MISLDRLPSCTRAVVVELPRGRGVAQRLLTLGISPGAEIVNLQNRGRGPLIVQVHGVRLALGRGQAARVMVEPGAAENDSEPECGDRPAAES